MLLQIGKMLLQKSPRKVFASGTKMKNDFAKIYPDGVTIAAQQYVEPEPDKPQSSVDTSTVSTDKAA